MGQSRQKPPTQTALRVLAANLRQLPVNLLRSYRRRRAEARQRTPVQSVAGNIFLHVHSGKVHRHSLRWYYSFGLGVMSVALFAVLTFTGLLLMVYYEPSTAGAYNSMKEIIYVVPSGKLVRNVHRWGAHLMVVTVFLHMARVFYTASYKRNRDFNWLVGLALLVLTLALSFTGYLLPWDQLAYWAVTIGVNIASSPQELTDALGITRFIDPGSLQRRLLLGADEIGDPALLRFYFLHCVLLPLLSGILISVHVWRVRKDGGLSRPDDAEEEEQEKAAPSKLVDALPHAFLHEFAAFMLILALTLGLAYVFDAPLKEPANPAVSENPAKSPWYFLGLQELVGYSAFMGGIGIPTLVLLGLGLIPYLDRDRSGFGVWFGGAEARRATLRAVLFSTLCCLGFLYVTVRHGWLRAWFPEIPQIVVTLVNPGTLLVLFFAIWSLRAVQKYDSVRIGAVVLFTCFFVGFVVLTYFATVHRGPNWDFYWWPSLWPLH